MWRFNSCVEIGFSSSEELIMKTQFNSTMYMNRKESNMLSEQGKSSPPMYTIKRKEGK